MEATEAWAEEIVEGEDSDSKFRSFVEEAKELHLLVEEWVGLFAQLSNNDTEKSAVDSKRTAKRISDILEKYQEQPQLLDPHLEKIVKSFLALIRTYRDEYLKAQNGGTGIKKKLQKVMNKSFKLVYTLCKVRGNRTITRFFPHEVSDVEATFLYLKSLYLLHNVDGATQSTKPATWETKYVLWLWLAILLLIPFNLATIFVVSKVINEKGETEEHSTINEMLSLAQQTLQDTAKTRDAAADFLSRLLTRPDMEHTHLDNFIVWARQGLDSPDTFLRTGILTTLAHIFKIGKRDALMKQIPIIFEKSISMMTGTPFQRKLCTRLTQRLGLTYLKPVVATWRYQRGNRSLLANLDPSKVKDSDNSTTTDQSANVDNPNYDIPDEMEEIIGTLLNGLRDKDTIVRWCAAKGIGRITERLPHDLGNDVVQSVIELFSPRETDSAWHGGCLALAELARRGLLLTHHLANVVPLVIAALQYDVRKGAHSIGTHVRDAACYVCWAFGRAYAPDVMTPHVAQLAPALIITSVFDREINCRRAASAAFQENVGRQGKFPDGIDIIQLADYFSLGNRNDAYLKISVAIAKISQFYTRKMIDHLATIKLFHWDIGLRALTSLALRNFVEMDREHFIDSILPSLIRTCTESKDLNTRHGSILGVAEIVLALSKLDVFSQPDEKISVLIEDVTSIIPDLERARLYMGRGSEYIRQAACRLIECVALSHLTLSGQQKKPAEAVPADPKKRSLQDIRNKRTLSKTKREIFMETIDENLKHTKEEITVTAVAAFGAFTTEYYPTMGPEWQEKFVTRFATPLMNTATAVNVRRGYASSLGALPAFFLANPKALEAVVAALVLNTKVEKVADQRDAETRRNATNALGTLAESLSDSGIRQVGHAVFIALLEALEDYSIDDRGDVGSWVREAALTALERWTLRLCLVSEKETTTPTQPVEVTDSTGINELPSQQQPLWTPELSQKLMGKLICLLGEKIDRTRAKAGQVFERILYCTDPVVPYIPHKDTLQAAFPLDLRINWSATSITYPRLVSLLRYECYRLELLSGYVTSVGGLTKSTIKDAGDSLLDFLRELHQEVTAASSTTTTAPSSDLLGTSLLYQIAKVFVQVFKNYQHVDRVTVPLLKTLQLMLASGYLYLFQPPKYVWSKNILALCKVETKVCSDIPKLRAATTVLCGLLPFSDPTRADTLQVLLGLLCSRYPKVRGNVAEQLFTTFVTHEGILPQEVAKEFMDTLSTTRWEESNELAEKKRNHLCSLLGVAIPDATLASSPSRPVRPPTDFGYKDLVKEAGY